mgnify:CR=1 FL=1
MPEFVCFVGCMGSGKDYQSKLLINKGYVLVNIGDSLREMAWDVLGWRPANDNEYEDFKKCVVVPEGGFFKQISGRQFLQNLGTQAIRKRFPDFWTELWKKRVIEQLENGKNVVCSDIRFIKEITAAKSICAGAKIIFCNYISDRYNCTDNHESEKLAQIILKDGFKDGDLIPDGYINNLLKNSCNNV